MLQAPKSKAREHDKVIKAATMIKKKREQIKTAAGQNSPKGHSKKKRQGPETLTQIGFQSNKIW